MQLCLERLNADYRIGGIALELKQVFDQIAEAEKAGVSAEEKKKLEEQAAEKVRFSSYRVTYIFPSIFCAHIPYSPSASSYFLCIALLITNIPLLRVSAPFSKAPSLRSNPSYVRHAIVSCRTRPSSRASFICVRRHCRFWERRTLACGKMAIQGLGRKST